MAGYGKKTDNLSATCGKEYGPDYLMTPKEAADYLRLNPGTMAIWRSREKKGIPGNPKHVPPFMYVGKCIRYRFSEIWEYLKKCQKNDND